MDTIVDAVQARFELITREFTAALPAAGSPAAARGWVGLDADGRARLSAASLAQAQRLARALDELQAGLMLADDAGGSGAASEALPAEVDAALAAATADVARRRAVNARLRALLDELLAREAEDDAAAAAPR